jgi:hypothetical protein
MRRTAWSTGAAGLAAGLALALGGCDRDSGGGIATARGAGATGGVPASAGPSAPATDPDERALQFARCLRDHGLDAPDPGEGGPVKIRPGTTVDKKRLSAAYEACRPFAPPDSPKARGLTPAEVDQVRQFAVCLRDNGVPDWPDPEPDGSFGDDRAVIEAKKSPRLAEALRTCEHLLP